ncbi:MAG: SGNH hydrolase domain-containing protein [Burkholderiaceae bacterium]
MPNCPRSWAARRLQFEDSVLDYVARTDSIRLVILGSLFSQYLPSHELLGSGRGGRRMLERRNGLLEERDAEMTLAFDAMSRTIDSLRRLGKRVIVVAPPPSSGADIGRCLERSALGKLVLGAQRECRLSADDYRRHQGPVLHFLEALRRRTGVEVIDPASHLCSDGSCATRVDGVFVYRDAGHLSYDGSRLLARRMNWAHLMGLDQP